MPTISIIIPCHNGAPFLPQCLAGIEQMALFSPPALTLETCFFDDGSTDNSSDIVLEWQENLRSSSTDALRRLAEHVRLGRRLPEDLSGQGCGYAKNRAVRELSSGEFLLFQDADDISFAGRAVAQIEACCSNGSDNVNVNAGDSNPYCGGSGSVHTVVGCNFVREPAGATERYTAWANALDGEKDLWLQQYRECTIIMPSWFMRRATFDAVGGFADNWADALQRFGVAPRAEPGDVLAGPKVPEDLVFFHRLLDIGGVLRKVPDTLLMYRYHAGATSAGIHRLTLMDVRIRAFERRVLLQKQNLPDETTYSRLDSGDIQQESKSTGAGIAVASVAGAASMPLVAEVLPFSCLAAARSWDKFMIWGAGRDGRKFFNRLTADLQKRVAGFIDVDTEKVGTVYAHHGGQSVPIIHFRDARAREWPFVVCVAMDRTDGRLEANIRSLGLQEGYDYWHFC